MVLFKGQRLLHPGLAGRGKQPLFPGGDYGPNNPEYRAAYNQLMWQRNTGTNRQGPYRTQGQANGCSGCDMCSGLICADCCCECMGGDLVPCC